MSDTSAGTAMAGKIRSKRGGTSRAAGGEIWRRVLPRIADDRLGLELRVAEFREHATSLSAVLPELPADAALIGLQLPGSAGLAVLDRHLLTGIVELQTTGRVSAGPVESRAVTPLDFVLVADVLEPWLAALSGAGALPPGPPTPTRSFADTRAVELGLDEGTFRSARVTLELGGGARVGTLLVLMPEREPTVGGGPPEDLAAAVLPLATRLEAILCRVRVPLSRIASAEVGTVLALPGASVRSITLEAPRGRVICPGHLGQSGGRRAVRLGLSAPVGAGALPRTGPQEPEEPEGGPFRQPEADPAEIGAVPDAPAFDLRGGGPPPAT